MFPATGGRIAGAILATALGLAVAASAWAEPTAEPTKVTEIRGKKLLLYETETGKPIDSLKPGDMILPLDILDISDKGKFKVAIPGKGEVWILKAQTVTDEGAPIVPVDCSSITESYATSRALGECK